MFVRNFIQDGDEIKLGEGVGRDTIELPDPRLCNLHLAVARVFAASGFAEVIEKYDRDSEDNPPTDFGEDLWRRLALLSM
jgi:hypothetical protein